MLKAFAAASFAALVAALSLPASAQSTGAPSAEQAHRPTGSYRSEMRKRRNTHKERARAGAEHVRQMRTQTPKQ